MAIISMQDYRITLKIKIYFCFKCIIFLALLAWTLVAGSIGGAQLSFVLFVCFMLMFFFYLLFYQRNISIERRVLLCLGNFFLLGAGVLMILLGVAYFK